MDFETLSKQVNLALFDDCCQYLIETYKVEPKIDYSVCSMKPGYNIKFRKSGRSLCTLYPNEGSFDCLIVIGNKEKNGFNEIKNTLSPFIIELYEKSDWLMIPVQNRKVLEDVKKLINLRRKP